MRYRDEFVYEEVTSTCGPRGLERSAMSLVFSTRRNSGLMKMEGLLNVFD